MGVEFRRDALPWSTFSKFKRHSAPFRRLKNQNGETNDKNLKTFDFAEGRYPMLSFCLIEPFIDFKLKMYNETLTGEMYKDFLLGKSFSNEMKGINFNDVSLNLADFYLHSHVRFRNGSQWYHFYELPQVTYSGFRFLNLHKCFGVSHIKC